MDDDLKPPFDPTAKTLGDMILPGQFSRIKKLADEAKLIPDQECQTMLQCKVEDLSISGADWFISHLRRCVEEFKNPRVKETA